MVVVVVGGLFQEAVCFSTLIIADHSYQRSRFKSVGEGSPVQYFVEQKKEGQTILSSISYSKKKIYTFFIISIFLRGCFNSYPNTFIIITPFPSLLGRSGTESVVKLARHQSLMSPKLELLTFKKLIRNQYSQNPWVQFLWYAVIFNIKILISDSQKLTGHKFLCKLERF